MTGYLRVSGAIGRRIAERAYTSSVTEPELADAVSRARIKRAGRGHQMLIPVTADQCERLAEWVAPRDKKAVLAVADELRQAEAEKAGEQS